MCWIYLVYICIPHIGYSPKTSSLARLFKRILLLNNIENNLKADTLPF